MVKLVCGRYLSFHRTACLLPILLSAASFLWLYLLLICCSCYSVDGLADAAAVSSTEQDNTVSNNSSSHSLHNVSPG